MNLEETDFISRTKSEIEMDGRNPAFTVFLQQKYDERNIDNKYWP